MKLYAMTMALCLTVSSVSYAEESAKPNIVLFLVDDMGVMDTSVPFLADPEGKPVKHPLNDYYKTPAMEVLANQGRRFSQFYANSVCSPTRASIMTGQSSARHRTTQFIRPTSRNSGKYDPIGWNWEGMNANSVTLPRALQAAGYRTIHSGKGHFGPKGKIGEDPKVIGFDVNIAGCSYGKPGTYSGVTNFGKGTKAANRAVPGLESYHGKDVHLSEALTLEINKSISQAVADKVPFFAYMSHYAAHAPFEKDPRFEKHYTSKSSKMRAFATLIEGVDKSLADIQQHLVQLGVAENTLILFLGDNGSDAPAGGKGGYGSSAPLRGKKATCYEGGSRVPFIASWAKPAPEHPLQKKFPIQQGFMYDEFATVMDLWPTVLEVAGVDSPEGHVVDGHSLWNYLAGARNSNPQQFLLHFPHDHNSSYYTAYRDQQWKLIYHYLKEGAERYELFDLSQDPYEKTNVSAAKPEILQTMLEKMRKQLTNANAQYPMDKETKLFLKVQ